MTTCPPTEAIARAAADPDAAPTDLLSHVADCPRCRDRFDPTDVPVHWEWLAKSDATPTEDRPTVGFLDRLKAAVRFAEPSRGGPEVPGLVVEEEIVRGGMGIVYRARDEKLSRTVAVKMLHPEVAPDRDRLARFLREAKALAALSHPNVVRLFSAGDANGRPYLVMEYVPGGNLRRTLRAGPWRPDDAARLLRVLTDATDAAHKLGIIHRDIKPANVLLEGERRKGEGGEDGSDPFSPFPLPPSVGDLRLCPKLADFGLARFLDAVDGHTATGEVLGTPEFMAPEQALGRTDLLGPPTDVWALGAVLYEVMTGRPPFAGPTRKDILRQVTATDPVPPDRVNCDVPADLSAICLKCLEKSPHQRYPTAATLRTDLDRFLAGRAVSARPRSWPGWLRDRVRRHPLRSLTLLGIALVPVAAVAGAAWAWREAQEERLAAVAEVDALRERFAATAAELYAVRIRLVYEAIVDDKKADAAALLDLCKPAEGDPDPRGWEWTYLHNRLRLPPYVEMKKANAVGLGFPPPGSATTTTSPDGRRIAATDPNGGVVVQDTTGRVLLRLPVPGGKVLGLHFSSNGRWLAARTGNDTVVLFDGAPGGLAGEG